MVSGDDNGIESVPENSGLAGIGNVHMLVEQVGVVPGEGGIQPHASAPPVPAGSAVALLLKLNVPRGRPPLFSGSKESFYRWVQLFREYAGINEFIRILGGGVPLDVSTPIWRLAMP